MKKILLSFNQGKFNEAMKLADGDLKKYEIIVDAIKENPAEISLSMENLLSVWQDPEDFVYGVLVGDKDVSFNGIPLNKKKALDLMQVPDQLDNLIRVVKDLKQDFESNPHHARNSNGDMPAARLKLSAFELDNEQLIISKEFIEAKKLAASTYTSSEK
ncbi:MAG: hypothetical protein WKF68_02530 [Daejeonella sp.]